MGREHKKRRAMKIKQAQLRQSKLANLRKKYLKAEMESDRDLIWEKVVKIAPWLTKKEFSVSIKKVKKQESEEENKE